MKPLYFALLLLFMPLASNQQAIAQDKPSPEAAKSVLDFYFNGQGKGVVLADIKVCTDVVDAACVEEVDHSLLQAGMQYKIWMVFVVPAGDTVESLSVQFVKDADTNFERALSVKGSVRYRTWRNFNPLSAGIWEVKVLDNREVELEELAKLSLVVSE